MGVEIAVSGLTKRFGSQLIWDDVTLTLPAGEISVLLGPSGTGKSVFLKTLVGLLRPDAGSVVVSGRDITALRDRELYEVRKLFGVLFQDGALFGSMSLYDNVAFPLREHTRRSESSIRETVMEKMDLVGLAGAEAKLPGEISGGQRQRVAVARALLAEPDLVIFDEPVSALDSANRAQVLAILDQLRASGVALVFISHDLGSVAGVADRIAVLYRGEIVESGPARAVINQPQHPYTRLLVASAPTLRGGSTSRAERAALRALLPA